MAKVVQKSAPKPKKETCEDIVSSILDTVQEMIDRAMESVSDYPVAYINEAEDLLSMATEAHNAGKFTDAANFAVKAAYAAGRADRIGHEDDEQDFCSDDDDDDDDLFMSDPNEDI